MKKLFLIVASALFINCSDDAEKIFNVSLIGTWKQVDITVNGESEKNECYTKNSITFRDDNSLIWLNHNRANCELDSIGAYIGTWEQKPDTTNYELSTSIGENFFMKKEFNKIEIQEDNDNSRIWNFIK